MRLRPPDPPLRDETVALRPFGESDVAAVERALADPEVVRWFWSERERTAEGFITAQREAWQTGRWASFAICEDEECVGAVFLEPRERATYDIGYWLLPEARGRGLASRATRLVAVWALRVLGAARVQLWTEPENLASQRVAELAGFQREGVLRAYGERVGRRVDAVFYSMIPADLGGGT